MATDTTRQTSAGRWVPALPRGSAWWRLVERNFMVYRRSWLVFLVGFLEPVFYLFSIGVGVAGLVGDFTLDNGTVIGYTAFVAPGMLAASAMNGALYDATYNIFFKMKYAKLYDAILSTPLRPWDVAVGEIAWALLRGTCYSAMFIVVMVAMGLTGVVWQSVTQRIREFGLRRAKGATARDIQKQILGELVVLSSAGILLGGVIAIQFPLLSLVGSIPGHVVAFGLASSVVLLYGLTLLCGAYPSRLASRVTPAEALHYE